jgi:hypothetical protein
MSDLASLGITVQRSFVTSSTEVNGITVGGSELTELAFTLPASASPIQVTFSKEGLGKKLVKIFKKEIQTGDAAFDATVYVSTDTTDATTKLLESNVVRAIIARIIDGGGHVEIDGGFVKLLVPGHQETDDEDTITLATVLVGK